MVTLGKFLMTFVNAVRTESHLVAAFMASQRQSLEVA